jgi:acetylornithine deacetylase
VPQIIEFKGDCMLESREDKLMQTVEALADDIIDFSTRLVAEPSTLGNEISVLRVTEKEFSRLGYASQKIVIDPQELSKKPGFAPVPWDYEGRYNVVAIRPANGEGGKSALFNGHLDVVSPEPLNQWSRDPFAPHIEDGWLYGRGSGDMKAGVAAMTYAVKAIDEAGFGLAAPVTLETVIEEECSGNGAFACRAQGIEAAAVLIPEPFGPTILTAQVGVCWFKVSLTGASAHALSTQTGVNAIEKCFTLIVALRELEAQLNSQSHPAFADTPHPLNLNVGVISGGDWPSTVPANAELKCRLAFLPGTPFSVIKTLVEQTIAAAAAKDEWLSRHPPSVEFFGFRSEGHQVDIDLPALKLLSDCQQALCGEPAVQYKAKGTTDLRSFIQFSKAQATCFGPVAENIHAGDERVNIASVIHTAKAYALFLSRWCKLLE